MSTGSGVAVTTRLPKTPTIASSGTASAGETPRASGPPISAPIAPPAYERPCSDVGESPYRSNMPSTQIASASVPTIMRPRACGSGAWRSMCAAPPTSSSGRMIAPLPINARIPVARPCPIGPAAPNHTAIAVIRPRARMPSATPSRRCSGSRSRAVAALRPAARANPPTIAASPFHSARNSRAIPMNGTSSGDGPRRRAGLRAVDLLLDREFLVAALLRAAGRVRVDEAGTC